MLSNKCLVQFDEHHMCIVLYRYSLHLIWIVAGFFFFFSRMHIYLETGKGIAPHDATADAVDALLMLYISVA